MDGIGLGWGGNLLKRGTVSGYVQCETHVWRTQHRTDKQYKLERVSGAVAK